MASKTKEVADAKSKKAKEDEAAKVEAKKRKDEADAKKAEEKAAKEEERAAKAAAKEEEKTAQRSEAIESGKLIVHPDDESVEFWESEKDEDKDYALDDRSEAVIATLKASKVPVMGKDILEEHGGGYPLYIPIFSTLKALGLVKEYRRRTGVRGGGGKAYMWVGE